MFPAAPRAKRAPSHTPPPEAAGATAAARPDANWKSVPYSQSPPPPATTAPTTTSLASGADRADARRRVGEREQDILEAWQGAPHAGAE